MTPPLIGMLHSPPLPGSPRYSGDLAGLHRCVLDDAAALVEGGFSSLMLENFGDAPFFPGPVPQYVVAHLTALATALRARFPDVELGLNVLRNDGGSALAIAHAVGARFIRVNVLCGARLTDQGIVHGIAHDLLRLRKTLGAESIRILADVNVKHSAPLAAVPLEQEVEDLLHRGGADGLIVTGAGTGKPTPIDELQRVKQIAGEETPVYVGSGVTPSTIRELLQHADGAIVGSSLKRDGQAIQPVDPARVAALIHAAK